MHENTMQILFFVIAFSVIASAKPIYNKISSFSEPCKASFSTSNTLYSAVKGCVLKGE